MKPYPNVCLSYINGQYVQHNSSAKCVPNLYPGNNKTINEVVFAIPSDLQHAVSSSQDAFSTWSAFTLEERSRILLKAADMLRDNLASLAELEVWDTGKPMSEALSVDVHSAADTLEYFAKIALASEDSVVPNKSALIYTLREPLGVCAAIGAWNYPLQIATWKAAPALVMGNTMVFKPSELTPMSALKLAEIFIQAGMPPGVFNVVLGDGEVGAQLLEVPGIAKVTFTGSVPTGKHIAKAAAEHLVPVTLELGGKSPCIIFEDSDLEQAVYGAMLANFYTQGEICSNGTRVFVAKSIQKPFLDRLVKETEKLIVGDPFAKETQIGSLISRTHMEKVKNYIDLGVQEGASLLCGGDVLRDGALDQGNFIAPTIFTNCDNAMTIAKEEIFGPVMSVLAFDDEDDVLQQANDTQFGLAAGVFTNDIKRAHRVAKSLQAGVCWINNYNVTPSAMPFGGYKKSGLGRENSLATLSNYTQLKSIYVELEEIDHPYK